MDSRKKSGQVGNYIEHKIYIPPAMTMLLLKLVLPLCLMDAVVSQFDCTCAVVCLTTENTMCNGVPTGRDSCLAYVSAYCSSSGQGRSSARQLIVNDATQCPNYSNTRETCAVTAAVATLGVVTVFCMLVPSACGIDPPPSQPAPPPALPLAPRPQISQC